jgi:hypothetical protein
MATIILTSNFYNDESIKTAYRETLKTTNNPLSFMTIWCGLAKRVLQSGQPMLRKPELNKVSLVVETNEQDAPAFKAMEAASMLKQTTELAPSALGEGNYEEWFKSYPYRERKGKKIKVRGASKRRFFNVIRTREDFDLLMKATAQYSSLCNKLPKDPERFLKDDFWREYAPELITGARTSGTSGTLSLDKDKITELLKTE